MFNIEQTLSFYPIKFHGKFNMIALYSIFTYVSCIKCIKLFIGLLLNFFSFNRNLIIRNTFNPIFKFVWIIDIITVLAYNIIS